MRVISVGEDPGTVDYSKTPPGVDEAYIRAGLDKQKRELEAQGWEVRMCIVPPELDEAVATLKAMLAEAPVDVVLMGGGLRMPPPRVELFEALMNAAHRSAPAARFAFDNDPNEGPAAVARQMRG